MLELNTHPTLSFTAIGLHAALDRMNDGDLDQLGFGVVRMTRAGQVCAYNTVESKLAGLSKERVLGKHFFTEVAPCTNNYLVSGRFDEPGQIDVIIPYVFTLRMRPTSVELRLLKSDTSASQYILVARGGS